ncbi:MAG: GntR family transcriptional regulator [Gammaproteobacteria bacterium]
MSRLFDHSASPLYAQVADVMRERIVKDAWPVGTRIPTLPALAREFQVASITVRQAIQLLKRDGLLSPEQGRGTFVRAKPPTHPRMQIESSLRGLADLYRTNPPRLIPLAERVGTPRVGTDEGKPAPKYRLLRRIHASEHQFHSVISAYLDERIFRLAPRRFRTELIIPVLTDLPQVKIASARQTLTIGTAGADTAQALNISVNAPVAELRRVFCAPDGTVIYLGELAYRGDFIRLDMDLLS